MTCCVGFLLSIPLLYVYLACQASWSTGRGYQGRSFTCHLMHMACYHRMYSTAARLYVRFGVGMSWQFWIKVSLGVKAHAVGFA